jgi:hypothetical protein
MPYTLSEAKSALHKTLYASTIYEVLHLAHHTLITITLTKQTAAKYALLICLTTMVSKFFDAGIGAAIPRLLKIMPHQARALVSVIVQQAMIIIPLAILSFSFTTKFYGYILLIVVLCGFFEAFSTLSRHAVHSTLQSGGLMMTEVSIMGLKVLTLIPLCIFQVNAQIIFFHFVFFILLNSTVIAILAWRLVMSKSRPLNTIYATLLMHKTVIKLRLQTFSTKISKELLSAYALTPLFTYSNGIENTWLFFFLTSIITSLYTIIKMSIGYTAAGTFTQLPEPVHQEASRRLNLSLASLISGAMTLSSAAYILALTFYPVSPQAKTTLFYVFCFSMITFTDLITLVYEQYFLVSGHYSIFQRLRIVEYVSLASIGMLCLKPLGMVLTTIILLCFKSIIFLAIRLKAQAQIKNQIIHPSSIPPIPLPLHNKKAPRLPQELSSIKIGKIKIF